MRTILLTLLILVTLFCRGQRIWIPQSKPVSSFSKDGTIYISFDSKSDWVQSFYPLDSLYECKGNHFEPITDTVLSKGIWTIKLSGKSVKCKERLLDTLRHHIMFNLMYACIDDKNIYCPCGAVFPLLTLK